MIAAVPTIISDMTSIAVFVAAVGAASALVWRTPPVKWLRSHLATTLGEWIERRVDAVVAPIATDVNETKKIALHHLGPNGDSERLRDRVSAIEAHLNGRRRLTRRPPLGPNFLVDWSGIDGDDEFDFDDEEGTDGA